MNTKEVIIRSQLISQLTQLRWVMVLFLLSTVNSYHSCYSTLLPGSCHREQYRVNSYHSCYSTFKKYCAREWTFKVNSYHSCCSYSTQKATIQVINSPGHSQLLSQLLLNAYNYLGGLLRIESQLLSQLLLNIVKLSRDGLREKGQFLSQLLLEHATCNKTSLLLILFTFLSRTCSNSCRILCQLLSQLSLNLQKQGETDKWR